MKIALITSLSLAVVLAVLRAGCQNTAPVNTTPNTNANMSDMSNMSHDMANMNHDMSNMQGHEMTNMDSDPNAAEQPYDLQFLDSMIHHHRGAIHMANMILSKTERPELKAFA